MNVQRFTFSPFMTNCYVCHDGGAAVLVDASCASAEEGQEVVAFLDEHDLSVEHLLLTHAHIDHILGCAFFEERFDQRFQMHAAARPFIERAEEQAEAFGVEVTPPSLPDTFLTPDDTIGFGDVTLEILHTPGHSPDSLTFHHAASQQALTGDVLFQGSIGRTQGLPQTSTEQLMTSIRETLLPLGDDTTIYPGHGPVTTIGAERVSNPFLQEGARPFS
jgi:glyoxylase-like metal-dependent hydrolase (beta-lactamase superfamily II)